MPCDYAEDRLHGYLDGELDAAGAADFERHLESCPRCREEIEAERALQASLAKAQLYERAPARLRRVVEAQILPKRSGPATTAAYWKWLAVAAMILFTISLGTLAFRALRGRSAASEFTMAAVDAHLRSLQQGHLTDVQSTDQHTVKPWFDGRVDFAPKVTDFSQQGFPLVGGRVDVLGGKSVAALVYGRRLQLFFVVVAPDGSGGFEKGTGERQGYHWLAWRDGGFDYVAVTDAGTADLIELRSLLEKDN